MLYISRRRCGACVALCVRCGRCGWQRQAPQCAADAAAHGHRSRSCVRRRAGHECCLKGALHYIALPVRPLCIPGRQQVCACLVGAAAARCSCSDRRRRCGLRGVASSRNGTFVNDVRVGTGKRVELTNGAQVCLSKLDSAGASACLPWRAGRRCVPRRLCLCLRCSHQVCVSNVGPGDDRRGSHCGAEH
jgi:hypothetical protein